MSQLDVATGPPAPASWRPGQASPGFVSRSLWAVRKYFRIFRTSLVERMTYRGDFFLATILRFLPMVTTILLWQAIYQGAQGEQAEPVQISNYDLHEMIAYLLLIHISRMFSSMPGLAGGITRDIREGTLKKYLVCRLLLEKKKNKEGKGEDTNNTYNDVHASTTNRPQAPADYPRHEVDDGSTSSP